jgi:hypothetical protein
MQVAYFQRLRVDAPPAAAAAGKWPRNFRPLSHFELLSFGNLWKLSCLEEAMEAINITGGNKEGKPITRPFRVHNSRVERLLNRPMVLNTSVIPRDLALRICHFYRADYCCLGMPMSEECAGLVAECGAETGPCVSKSYGGPHGAYASQACRARWETHANASGSSSGSSARPVY